MVCLGCNHYTHPDREMERVQGSGDCRCSCHPWNKPAECMNCVLGDLPATRVPRAQRRANRGDGVMRGQTLTIQQNVAFEVEECCACGVLFAMPADLTQHRLADKRSFYCPNGHPQSYVGKTDEEKRRDAEAACKKAELRLDAERDQRLAAERELKRHRQRAKGGACPVCNRSFVQLARHIKGQHPNFEASRETE